VKRLAHQMDRYAEGHTDKLRLSNSDIQTFVHCGVKYQFRREDAVYRTTVKMAIGTAVAKGACEDNNAKMTRQRALPIADIIDVAVAEYEHEIGRAEVPDPKSEVAAGKDDSAAAARVFAVDVSPRIMPVAAEKKTIIAFPDRDFELAATFDYAEKDSLGDLKTGRQWTQERADRCGQLSAYGIVFSALYKAYPRRLYIDSVYRDGKAWAAKRIWTNRGPEDYERYYRLIGKVYDAIKAGVFLPASEMDWLCSPSYCEYWHVCPHVPNTRRP
jgi:hypothetical protein